MATRNYPLNTTFKSLSDASFKLGGELNRNRPSVKQYSGVAGAVQDAGKQAPVSPEISSLGTVTTPYGGSTNYEGSHKGIDVARGMGSPIPALMGGEVVSAVTGQKQDASKPSFGNTIVIKNEKGDYFRYSHLNDVYVPVAGTKIQKGQIIGTEGNTGSTYSTHGGTGSHLDLRIFNAAKKYYDPSQYLKQFNQ